VVPRLFRLCLISTRLLTFLILILIDFRTLPKNYLPFDTTTIKVGIVMRYIDWLIRSSSDATSAVTKKNLYDSVRMTMVSDLQHICSYARKIIKNEFIFGSQVLSIKTRS